MTASFSLLLRRAGALLVLLAAACSSFNAGLSAQPSGPAQPAEIVFYDWAEDMPQSVLDAFAKEYGISVRYETYNAQEDAVNAIQEGKVYDVVVLDSRYIPLLAAQGKLAKIDKHNVPNLKNISSGFRNLAYDPENQYTVPYNWGTTGLVVNPGAAPHPVTRWADLWDPAFSGKVLLWKGVQREVIGAALKTMGYSINSENPEKLEEALQKLLELKPNLIFGEDIDPELGDCISLLQDGTAVVSMGWAYDVLVAREEAFTVDYVIPEEGTMLWADNFIVPANSPNQDAALLFLDFILRPEIGAELMRSNNFSIANDPALALLDAEMLKDPVVFPPADQLANAEMIMPLSPEGDALYTDIWQRFIDAR